MSYKQCNLFFSWRDVICPLNPSIIIKSIESHTKKRQLIIIAHHWAAFIRRCELCRCFLMEHFFIYFILLFKKLSLYIWGSQTVKTLLITVFLVCTFLKVQFKSRGHLCSSLALMASTEAMKIVTLEKLNIYASLQKQDPGYKIHRYQRNLLSWLKLTQ